ncbi:MAG: RluA family pseudouridine synthase [Blastocatellia bacterium]|nr:RluA family pseudouridine synthase [Blastocatellia bacterium]
MVVAEPDAGKRLDQYIAIQIPNYSRTRLHKQICDGDVLVNSSISKPSYRVRKGDLIEVEFPAAIVTELVGEDIPLDIIYEDEDLVVINKPSGLVVHPGAGINSGTLANGLVAHFQKLSCVDLFRPGIVHRLDRDTSGVMIVAKSELAHQHLSEQFASRVVKKRYTALVYGATEQTGVIELPIGRHPTHRVKMSVSVKGRYAYTSYSVIKRFNEFTLLDVEIKTGRTHQIRVHLAHINHPVVGDDVYGVGWSARVKAVQLRRQIERVGRQLLHASNISFIHPKTGKLLNFTAALPKDFEQMVLQLTSAQISH